MQHAQSLPSPTSDGWVWKILGPFPHMQLQAQMAEKDPPPPHTQFTKPPERVFACWCWKHIALLKSEQVPLSVGCH